MKMLAEESSLYDWIKLGSSISKDDARVLRRKVREVTRAVEERCAKVAESFHVGPSRLNPHTIGGTDAQKIAAALRRK